MKILGKIALALLCLTAACCLAAAAYSFAVTAGTNLDDGKFLLADSRIAVFGAEDDAIAEISLRGANKNIRLSDLPAHVKNAFIAAEDKRFYSHHGLDYKGMARALLKNIRARAFAQGASTISQQLVKNTQLTSEKTLKRKLQEIKLTRQLEKKYSKDQILEMYLNTIYFGHTCYGIAAASEFYFGKDASALTAAEGATLAAIIRSPNRYSPFVAPKTCEEARNGVLLRMRSLGYLNEQEYEVAKGQPLPTQKDGSGACATYLSAVYSELENIPFLSPYRFLNGCRIYTYLDSDLQEYAETLTTDADRSGKSILICDNESGGIRAWYTTEGELRRQPGSVIKPLAVYAPALEENLVSPATPILDEPVDFSGYAPENYKNIYHGYVSVRRALAESLNVPAVKLLNSIGVDTCEKYLLKSGLPLTQEDKNLSLALGGTSGGYTLRELVGAYTAFPRNGARVQTAFIRKIVADDGSVLYERTPEQQRVYSADTAELINSMLADAARTGTAKKLASLPFPICAKTGTCGTEQGNTDAYTLAYTTRHTLGVWMGNADNERTNITGGGLPCHYAMLIAKQLYKNDPPRAFSQKHVAECLLDRASYEQDHILALAAEHQPKQYVMTELFRKQNIPVMVSPVFAEPAARTEISLDNNTVKIELCLTNYYGYIITRETDGKSTVIREGKCNAVFYDRNLKNGKIYTYTVTPFYTDDMGCRVLGKAVTLPSIYTKSGTNIQNPPITDKEWWET